MRILGIIAGLTAMVSICHAYEDEVDFKWIRSITCEQIRPYSDNMCAFKQDSKWGYMDKTGNVLIAPVYDECYDFTDGYAIACKNGKWGIINKKGEAVTGFVFDKMNGFKDGVTYAEEGNRRFFVSHSGIRQALSPKYDYGDYSEGLAPIMNKKNHKWGFINKKGTVVIEMQYDSVYNFSGGIALVKNKQKSFYITKKGSKKNILGINEPIPLQFVNGYAKINYDNRVRFLNQSFHFLPFTVKDATDFNENGVAAILMNDNTMRYINEKGMIVTPAEYDKMGNFNEDLAWISKNGKYGYINPEGEIVIDTLFTSATDFKDGIAFVTYNNRMGSIKIKNDDDIVPNMEISDITIKDANLNNKVEAEEKFAIALTLSNPTGETLRDVNLQFAGQSNQAEWFDFNDQTVFIPELKANSDTIVTFGGAARLSLVSDKINLEFRGSASNLFNSVKTQYSFDALGINACKPIITKYWVYKENHTPIEKGDIVNLKLTVKNDGSDLAKNVLVDLLWPEGVSNYENSLKIPVIRPGETAEMTSKFVVDSISDEGITVVAKLSEYTHKHKDIKYLSFHTGRMNAEVNLESGVPTMMYQYSPDSRYFAQSGGNIGKPQVVSGSSAPANQEIVKENTLNSDLLSGIKPVSKTDMNKFALIIGNEDYNSFKQTATYEVNVDYAVRDANVFAEYATNYMGVPKENVILLQNATYAQMNFNINKLLSMSKTNPDNIELYFFYAGHGQHDVDSKETYLMPVDVSISSPTAGIKLEKLYADIGASRAKRSYIFMDACYSGVGRGIVIKPKQTPVTGNTIVFTATSSTQRSMPYKAKQHGMFTYFLLKTLKETNGNISIANLYDSTKKEVVKNSIWINNSEQTPELISGSEIEDGWENWKL